MRRQLRATHQLAPAEHIWSNLAQQPGQRIGLDPGPEVADLGTADGVGGSADRRRQPHDGSLDPAGCAHGRRVCCRSGCHCLSWIVPRLRRDG